ncbi:prostatic acid phosphatase-like, partial [Choristoneura fumiferana]|uniref:prostatic acid phosphatase-like n=1 Tax=Choristoneura fumiferana TaxID=7141 RepID=UPI003D158774
EVSSHAIGNEVIEDQELVLSFVVNRHGDRSPDSDELSLSSQAERLKNITYIEGLEGLTNTGKRRAYQIGKFLRQRYGIQGHNILSTLYLQDELAVRSTDKERTKMTALMAMAAAYPPEIEQQWDDGIGKVWQPVPYTTVPLSEDYLRYYSNCAHFKCLMADAKMAAWDAEFAPFADLIPLLKAETGRNFTEDPVLFETLHDLFKSQLSLGLDIPEWSKPILPRLNEASLLAYRLFFKTDEMKKLGGGVLLHKFLEAADAAASGQKVKKLHMFSAHDYNMGGLMAASRVEGDERIMPAYGSLFALELYKSKSGEYSVLPVYLEQAGQCIASHLRILGCPEPFCDLQVFRQLTKDYVLPEAEFHKICKTKIV